MDAARFPASKMIASIVNYSWVYGVKHLAAFVGWAVSMFCWSYVKQLMVCLNFFPNCFHAIGFKERKCRHLLEIPANHLYSVPNYDCIPRNLPAIVYTNAIQTSGSKICLQNEEWKCTDWVILPYKHFCIVSQNISEFYLFWIDLKTFSQCDFLPPWSD